MSRDAEIVGGRSIEVIPDLDILTDQERVILKSDDATLSQAGVLQLADVTDLQNGTNPGKVISHNEFEKYTRMVLKKPVITIGTHPAASTSFTQGAISGSLSVSASVDSGTTTYQWYSNTTNSNTGGTLISGATNASFTIPTTLVAGNYYYYCVVSALYADSVTSNVAHVSVVAAEITITTHPTATTNLTVGVISGSLSVAATVTGGATLSYQWYSNTTNSNTGGTAISGATGASYAIPTGLGIGSFYYYCVVKATGGAADKVSNVARVNVAAVGTSWVLRTGAGSNWRSVCYGAGLFVAVGASSTYVMTSPDGITWTSRAGIGSSNWRSVCYGAGTFVAVGDTFTNKVMTSPDGINWTVRTPANAHNWASVAYGNGTFVAVAGNGTNRAMYSPDGFSWYAAATDPAGQAWRSICFGNGRFVAVGNNGASVSSTGMVWSPATTVFGSGVTGWSSVYYGAGLFVAVAQGPGQAPFNYIMTSPDGITWTLRSTADAAALLTGVCFGNNTFVAVAQGGTSGARAMTSPDGVNWTLRSTASNATWQSVCYGGNKLFVAVAYDGAVMTTN